MHKGHTGFYKNAAGGLWLDFQKRQGWWVDSDASWESFHTYDVFWEIEFPGDLKEAVLVIPEEYLK